MKETIKESLTCILTEDEMAKLAAELGHLHQDLEQLKLTRKRLVELIELKSTTAVTGEENRMVECIWEADYELGFMRLIRQDTFREVRNYVMSADERQQTLFGQKLEEAISDVPTWGEVESTDPPKVETTEEPVAVGTETAGDDTGAFINDRNKGRRKTRAN